MIREIKWTKRKRGYELLLTDCNELLSWFYWLFDSSGQLFTRWQQHPLWLRRDFELYTTWFVPYGPSKAHTLYGKNYGLFFLHQIRVLFSLACFHLFAATFNKDMNCVRTTFKVICKKVFREFSVPFDCLFFLILIFICSSLWKEANNKQRRNVRNGVPKRHAILWVKYTMN